MRGLSRLTPNGGGDEMEDYTIKIGTIEEWEEEAPEIAEKIINKYWDINTYYEWYEAEISIIKSALEAVGFRDVDVEFSGFWNQGDGASFTGKWSTRYIQATDLDAELAGTDGVYTEIRALAELLQKIGKNHEWEFSIRRSSSRYVHENTVSIADATFFHVGKQEYESLPEKTEDAILEQCREIMQAIYSNLSSAYEYLTSREVVKETLSVNDYKFDAEGKIYG